MAQLAQYRRNQAEQNPELWTEIPASEIKAFVPVEQPLIDADALETEFTELRPTLVSAAKSLGARCSARTFVRHLLNNHVSQSHYPQTRLLLQVMLVLPASSVQSERDFSLQVWADSLAIHLCPSRPALT